ncbi:MAG: hypothetical protein QME54_02425 [Actinomycetota bacterium]|nr:hypothetical protein [Actinomycetota bacterium]
MNELEIKRLILRKMDVFRSVLPQVSLRFFSRKSYLLWARTIPQVQEEIQLGWYENFEAEFKEPVLALREEKIVGACPSLFVELLKGEPPQIHRLFVEGAFLSRLLLFLVPGTGWEAEEQVRKMMRRHFPLLLAATEAVRGTGPLKKK